MREQLEKAGVNVAGSRLATLAFDLLRKVNRSPVVATDDFLAQVMKDCDLLRALMPAHVVRKVAFDYLQARANDMAGKAAGETPAASRDGGEASQNSSESHAASDRPAPTSTSRPKQPAPGAKIPKSTGRRIATSGIFATVTIGAGRRPLGQVRWREIAGLFRLRRGDAVNAAKEAFILKALEPFVPDDLGLLETELELDPRAKEIATAVEAAEARWKQLEKAVAQRPVGDLERILLEPGVVIEGHTVP